MMANTGSYSVQVRDVEKRYGVYPALRGVTLDVRENEFFTFLGPSGCGKTTLLRIIAGFENLNSGQILLQGKDISALGPNQRPINTVFQNYALFPHMTVAENIAFGMKRLKKPRAEIDNRVRDMLALVQLTDYRDRKPTQMSGGQQQRVALARALAPSPQVLLLDEPLSALDLKLRQAMRSELKSLQRETGITFIFVTHDQEEALSMSDRIAVMSQGLVQQVGTPAEIYRRPRNRFVADFIGEANLLPVEITGMDGREAHGRMTDGSKIALIPHSAISVGGKLTISVRPEHIDISAVPSPATANATIIATTYLGDDTHYQLSLADGSRMVAHRRSDIVGNERLISGCPVMFSFAPDKANILED
jgi:spermidine/putrescine transport system ATP-binding protein